MDVVILVSTIDRGIGSVADMLLPPRDDIKYIVTHQFTCDEFRDHIPEKIAARADVVVSKMEGKGVARSRNRCLELCPDSVGVALMADDDGELDFGYIDDLKELFTTRPDMDIACLRIETYPGEPPFNAGYSPVAGRINDTYELSVATPEIALRPGRVKAAGIRFDERFGAGAGFLQFADENIFIADAIKAGLRVWSIPQYVVRIHFENTIKKMHPYDARQTRALGGMDARVRRWAVATAKAAWFAFKYSPDIRAEGYSPWKYFRDRMSGVKYFCKTSCRK